MLAPLGATLLACTMACSTAVSGRATAPGDAATTTGLVPDGESSTAQVDANPATGLVDAEPHDVDTPADTPETPPATPDAPDALEDAAAPQDAPRDGATDDQAPGASPGPGAPRERGDVCPGAVLSLDGLPHRLFTQGFADRADYPPACAAATTEGRVDAVLSYTLPTMRDVALEVSAAGAGELAVDIADTCGDRTRAAAHCAGGNPARMLLRRQPPGTYFVTVAYAGAPGRAITVTARSAPSPVAHPADRCPGVGGSSSGGFTIPIAGLGPHTTLACLPWARTDAFFEHTAPAEGRDLVAVARSSRGTVGLSLRERCAEAADLACARGPTMVWRRFGALTPGARYTLVAATGDIDGTLAVDTFDAPTATEVEARDNMTCALAAPADPSGGRYVGETAGGTWGGAALCGGLSCVGGRTVWFSLRLPVRARLLAQAVGAGFEPVLSVFAGDNCPGRLVPGGCGDGGNTARLDVTLDPGRYRVALAGCGPTAAGRYTFDWVTGPPDTRR